MVSALDLGASGPGSSVFGHLYWQNSFLDLKNKTVGHSIAVFGLS